MKTPTEQRLITALGLVLAGFSAFSFSFGIPICLIYAFYLWGDIGLTFGSSLWQGFTHWIMWMFFSTLSLMGSLWIFSLIGINLYTQYIKPYFKKSTNLQ